jgi:hypothetical protein
MKNYSVNDWILYREQESSDHPEPGAHDISPAPRGDAYSYLVDRLWRVTRVNRDGSLEATGSNGRVHRLPPHDRHIEKVGWLRRRLLGRRLGRPSGNRGLFRRPIRSGR